MSVFLVDGTMSGDVVFVAPPKKLIEIRGLTFDVSRGDPMFAMCLAMLALEDKRVDAVFEAMGLTFEGVDGKTIKFGE